MMQCVKCNKSSLFARRLKTLEKQGKGKYPCEEKKSNVFETRDINSFLYGIQSSTTLQFATWIEFELKLNLIELNSNSI